MTDESSVNTSPPYVSWLTFNGFIEWLQKEGIPAQIDRSVWATKYSGSTGSQLMTGLRYLGLLDGEVPTDSLREIVAADTEARKQIMGQLLQERYSSVFQLGLANATPNMLRDAFSKLGVDGHTSRKSQSFFLNACKFANIELASSLKKRARNRQLVTTKRPRANSRKARSGDTPQQVSQPPNQANAGQSTTVTLGNGGTLTLSLDANALTLEERDRQFINDLVGQFQAHEADEEGTDDE